MDRLKTVLILSDKHVTQEYRLLLGRVNCADLVLELLSAEGSLSAESVERIADVTPQILFVHLAVDQEKSLRLLRQTHQEFAQLPILASGGSYDAAFLIEAMRLGVNEFIARPVSPEQLREAYRRIHKRIFGKGAENGLAQIFSFFGSKGGSGTTSVATNLAVCLGKLSGRKLLLVDLDLHLGEVASFFGVRNNKYLYEGRIDASDHVISNAIISHQRTGIDLLALTHGYHRQTEPIAAQITHLLSFLQRDYDYILVDSSSRLDENSVAALDASHLIFLISKHDLPSLRNTQRLLGAFEKLGYTANRVRLLINRYSNNGGVSLKTIERALGYNVFWSITNDFRSLVQATALGEVLTEKKQPIPLVKAFYELSAEVLGMRSDRQLDHRSDTFLMRLRDSAAKSTAAMAPNPTAT
jgi:pilus assembly protein CpaE